MSAVVRFFKWSWYEFGLPYSERGEKAEAEINPVIGLIITLIVSTFTLILHYIPYVYNTFRLENFYIPIILAWIACISTVLSYYFYKTDRRNLFLIFQILDTTFYCASSFSLFLLCKLPYSFTFAALYMMMASHYSKTFPLSVFGVLAFSGGPLAVILFLKPELLYLFTFIMVVFAHITLSWSERTALHKIIENKRKQREWEANMERNARLASLGTLAGGMAHEINNPLAVIRMNTDMLSSLTSNVDNGDWHKRIQSIYSAVERINRVINNVRNFTAPMEENVLPFSCHLEIQKILDVVISTYNEENIGIDMKLTANKDEIKGNQGQFQQAILNILTNSRDALLTNGGGRIKVTSHNKMIKDKEYIELVLEDNGPGIIEKNIPYLFDMFFTTKEPGKGMGMGLWIVHKMIEEMKGLVNMESAYGKWTKTIISLPLFK